MFCSIQNTNDSIILGISQKEGKNRTAERQTGKEEKQGLQALHDRNPEIENNRGFHVESC